MTLNPRPNSGESFNAALVHEVQVWRRVIEGSEQAECSCGWKGPKRTTIGGLAYEDAKTHEDDHA